MWLWIFGIVLISTIIACMSDPYSFGDFALAWILGASLVGAAAGILAIIFYVFFYMASAISPAVASEQREPIHPTSVVRGEVDEFEPFRLSGTAQLLEVVSPGKLIG
jgi:hypothetical protein